jgi:NAD(P) transhydrogenase subunit beta
MLSIVVQIAYLFSATAFIVGLKLMASPARAKTGNLTSVVAMLLAVGATVVMVSSQQVEWKNLYLLVGILLAGTLIGRALSRGYEMTRMPELISLFNALGGLSAAIIGVNAAFPVEGKSIALAMKLVLMIGVLLGAASFTASIVAYFKLAGKLKKGSTSRFLTLFVLTLLLVSVFGHWFLPVFSPSFFVSVLTVSALALLYGFLFALPVGGADMPVLISVLNAVTGVATALSGVLFESSIMLLGGILVGSTGVLLTIQMCKAMNRPLQKVLIGSRSNPAATAAQTNQDIKTITSVEVASILAFSKQIAIVPGFGLAVSQAQKLCFELQKTLTRHGATVKYIIHPVAGRMPGHMNVLLAEANVDYDDIVEMDEVNHNMEQFDACIVIGANDVVNPGAEDDENSPVYGMPIIKTYRAKHTIVMKRGMAAGYSGAINPLFERANCRLLFGDAKASLQQIVEELNRI